MSVVLEARELAKSYGQVEALKGVSLSVSEGEVIGLLGDNGAGKSTLVSLLSGAASPTAGEIWVDGARQSYSSPREAQLLGIQTVYQDLSLATHLTPAENVYLGREPVRAGVLGRLGWLDRSKMNGEAEQTLSGLRVHLKSLRTPCSDLSGGQRQAVAIARAITWAKRLIMLDEPTAALGVAQTQMVLDVILELRHRGLPVILISHNMHDVFAVTTRIVVLRQGRVVLDCATAETTQERVVGAIMGATAMATGGAA
jgi:simple sugar transport system ATP-binding protein